MVQNKNERYFSFSELGNGAFGEVYLVIDRKDFSKKAIKRIDLRKLDGHDKVDIAGQTAEITKEATALAILNNHPNILTYFDSFPAGNFFCIVTEYCEKGTLNHFIKKQRKQNIKYTEEPLLWKWLRQCASALEYLESKKIIHRDIKPENIFLTTSDDVKLGDFGLSHSTVGKGSYIKLSKHSGTYMYCSPETVNDNKYSHKTDIWSLGVTFYELSTLENPFYKDNETFNLRKIGNSISDLPYIDLPEVFSKRFNTLIKKMMIKEPIDDRIDAKELNKIISSNFDVFLSYCSVNKNDVYKFYDHLTKRGYNIWIDKNKMIVGDTDELMKKGIDQSELFMCCATTSYCSSENCLLEFNYAVHKKKKIIYILFEKYNGEDDRMNKLDAISFRFAGQIYYKHFEIDGIVKAIEELRREQSNINSSEMRLKQLKLEEIPQSNNNLIQNEVTKNDLIEPKITGKQVKSINITEINNAKSLYRMAVFNQGSNILITGPIKGVIHKLDINLNYIEAINPNNCLKQPWGICVQTNITENETMFVSDLQLRKIFVFDSKYNLIKSIGNDLKCVEYLSTDSQNLFISEYWDDVLSLYNIDNGQLIQKIKVERPAHSTNDLNNIYVVSNVDCENDSSKRKLIKIKGGNCINIISKLTCQIINKIQFNDWFWPLSIHSSKNEIYTIANVLDSNAIWSKNNYLIQINKQSKNIINKIELEDIDDFSDAIYLNNNVILCGVNGKGNEIRTIEFD